MLLKDESALPTSLRVGEPLTRTIRVQAQGLAFEQLPELELAAPQGAEVYPDKADTRTRDDGEWLYGERVRKFAFVPSRPGRLTIPGMSLRWWDTVNDREQVAELPAQTIEVLPASGSVATPAPTAGSETAATIAPAPATTAASPAMPVSARSPSIWQWLAATGFALWLLTLALWWRARRASPVAASGVSPLVAGSPRLRADFLRACALGDFAGAERALVAWARSEQPTVRNLGELSIWLDDAAQREALATLQRMRYAGEAVPGLGSQLERAFKGGLVWRPRGRDATSASALPALYPAPRD